MKTMKYLTLAVLLAVTGVVLAQQYASTTTVYAAIAASATSNLVTVSTVTLTKYEDVTITAATKLAGSGTDNTVLSYYYSVDGTTYETTPSVVLTIANTGTTTKFTSTNINVGAIGYLSLRQIVNGDTGDALTVTNTFTLKPQRFGK